MKNQLAFVALFLLPFLALAQSFDGKYHTTQNGVTCTVEFKQSSNQQLRGLLAIGDEKGTVKGVISNGIASGTITDASTQQVFQFEASLEEPYLAFVMYVKDEDSGLSAPITFVLERSTHAADALADTDTKLTSNLDPAKAPKKSRDVQLVGIWRTTENRSSGTGEFYMSMSTDYFMQFTQEGIAGVWKGKSAGGGAGSSFAKEADGEITQVFWYSEKAVFVLVDPNSKEELKTAYQFHDGKLVTTDRDGKYIFWTKIQ